ncbi:MAG: universal stress protein [Coriobacteriia bacterium]|nr:universal stress protein [Coriobacteriia bacterium]MBN2839454.1 universal stress protein [Coriobacteriia bacterium]
MFSHAIVATDLGPSSEGIVACAGQLGVLGVRDAILVYAIDLEKEPSPADDAAFSRQIESLEDAGIRVHVETPLGYPPHAIVALAEEHGAGIIVMGTRGQGLFQTGFSGSMSSDVVRLSPVPVLLMPSNHIGDAASGSDACSRMLTSVLVPVDVFEPSDRICSLACGLAPRGVERMELIHVTPLTFEAAREGRETQANERIEALAERAREHGVRDVRASVVRGSAVEVLPQRIGSGDYSLVVLAPRTHDVIDGEIGSVASAVIQSSSIPMLLAPTDPSYSGT